MKRNKQKITSATVRKSNENAKNSRWTAGGPGFRDPRIQGSQQNYRETHQHQKLIKRIAIDNGWGKSGASRIMSSGFDLSRCSCTREISA